MKKVFIALLYLASMTGYAQTINEVLNQNATKEKALALTITMPAENDMPKFVGSGDVIYQLTTNTETVNNTLNEFFVDNTDNIYPGAIVIANKDLANGDPTLAGLGYGKVTVSVNFNTGGKGSRSGVTNSPDGVRAAINEILNEAASNGKRPSVSYQYHESSNTSLASMVANLNVSASFLKAKANVNTSVSSKEISVTEVEDYKQPYYTVTVTQEYDKSKYFASHVTGTAIQNKINQFNAPLAIISSVTYGRRVYHFKEFSSSDFNFKGNQSASGYGQSISSNQDITKSSTAKREWIYVTGSDEASSGGLLGGKTVKKAISEKVNFDPKTDEAVPIAYKVIFLGTGKTATVSTTGSYKAVTKYTPCFKEIYFDCQKHATQVGGTTMRYRIDYKVVHVLERDANGNIKRFEIWDSPKCKGTYAGYADYRQWVIEKGDTRKTLVIPTSDLPDYKNCYVFGEVHHQVRTQTRAGQDPWTWREDTFTPTSTHVTAHIDGSNYAGQSLKIRMENK